MAININHRDFIRRANPDTDTAGILAIYAPFVEKTAVSFEVVPPTLEEMKTRISTQLLDFPWIVYEKDGEVLGFACGSRHRVRKCYDWSVESGIYISPSARRQGIGKDLYEILFEILAKQGYYTVIGGLTLPNDASYKLHKNLGFEEVGTYRKIGFKFGQWWDALWLQKELQPYSNHPKDSPIPFSQIEF